MTTSAIYEADLHNQAGRNMNAGLNRSLFFFTHNMLCQRSQR